MSTSRQRDEATCALSSSEIVEHSVEVYRLAWEAALLGAAPPTQELALRGLIASDQDLLRPRLEELDEQYRMRTVRARLGVPTVDVSPEVQSPPSDTAVNAAPTPNFAATADFSLGDAAGGARAQPMHAPGKAEVRVAGYEILGELGRGGMGVVYKARQLGLNRLVALKMLLAGAHANDHVRARFRIEAEAVAHLQHPNVVQIYDVGEQDGLPYFSLEFVDGSSLAHQLGGKPQPARGAAELLRTLARAMHYAHEHGIVHRDLKPANVLLTSSGVPKIADFGLAKQVEGESSQTKSGTLMGTPSYMAPEQARGAVHAIGPAADVHALGAILYETLTGRPPFVAASVMDTIMQVLRVEAIPPSHLHPGVPRDLETICLKCLQKEPERRYASAGALADDLDAFLAGEAIQARPLGAPERLWRWCRRNPRVAVLTTATFLLLVVGIIGSLAAAFAIARERNQKEIERIAADEARQLAETRRVEADHANEHAQQNAATAKRNAEEATKQGKLALSALGTLIDEVQKQIGDTPGTQDLKLKLLETALEGLDKVAKGDENSRLLGQSMAAAYMKVGQLFQQLGQTEKAYAQYEKLHAIIEDLAKKDPNGDVAQSNLAATYTMLGEMSLELRRDVHASLAHYQKALEIRRGLQNKQLSDKLNPTRVKQEFAESCTRVGVTFLRLGEPEKARPYFQEATQVRQELASVSAEPMTRLDVARSFNALGEVEFRARNWPAARAHFTAALDLCRAVQSAHPENPGFQRELANTLGNFGTFDVRTAELAAARDHLELYLKIMEDLATADPRNAQYQRYLGLAHYRMGTLARLLRDEDLARRSDKVCLEIREKLAAADAKNERRQMELILALPRCGQRERAARLAEQIQNGKNVDREILFEIAQCYSQCATAAVDNADECRQYLNHAITALRKAVALGFTDEVLLETEPDLAPLRSLPDYQALLTQLKPK